MFGKSQRGLHSIHQMTDDGVHVFFSPQKMKRVENSGEERGGCKDEGQGGVEMGGGGGRAVVGGSNK